MVDFLTDSFSSCSSGSGIELMNGELRMLTSSLLRPLVPFVSSTERFVPEMRYVAWMECGFFAFCFWWKSKSILASINTGYGFEIQSLTISQH